MEPWLQWSLSLIIPAILGFYLGVLRERRRKEVETRREALKPIEGWLQDIMRLVSIIGDELSAIAQGLPGPLKYGMDDRAEIAESLSESTPRIRGILDSDAFNTRRTKNISSELARLITQLSVFVETHYLQSYHRLFDKLDTREDPSAEMNAVLLATASIQQMVKDAYKLITDLKTKLT